MDEYKSVCYLDVQKTGSTFVSAFLREHLNEAQLRFAKHGRVRDDHDPKKFYFISCRDPLNQYRSLFQFGCAGEGVLRSRLETHGRVDLYEPTQEGFARWLEFVLDPANAGFLSEDYGKIDAGLFGLQTFRFLALSLVRPMRKLKRVKTVDDVRKLYENKNIAASVVRTESLNADLARLAEGPLRPFVRNVDAALKALSQERRINASKHDPAVPLRVSSDLMAHVEAREWFMYDVLGYDRISAAA